MTVKSNRFEQHLEAVWIFIVQISPDSAAVAFHLHFPNIHLLLPLLQFPWQISKYQNIQLLLRLLQLIPLTNFDPYFTLKIVKKKFWNFEKLVLWIYVLLSNLVKIFSKLKWAYSQIFNINTALIKVFVKVWMNLNDMKRFASDLFIKEAKNCISKDCAVFNILSCYYGEH